MEQKEFEAKAKEFVDGMNSQWAHQVCGMLRPKLLSCSAADLSLELAFPVSPWEENPGGVVHGGIMATMIDTAIGTLCAALCGGMTPTISLQTNYLRPAPADGSIVVRAQVDMLGRSIVYTSARAWDSRHPDKPVATAEGTYRNHG